jgi:hypothetical protein
LTGRQSKLRLYLLAGVVVVATVEGLALASLHVTRPLLDEEIRTKRDIWREQTVLIRELLAGGRLLVVDSVLGWRYRSGHATARDQTNSHGLRSAREYSAVPAASVVRVAAFGDSFVYGNEVDNANCWSALVEQIYPRLEVLNYGVGGYGNDQAYLRFLADGRSLSPKIAILGFAPTDFGRVVNVYRRFLSNRELPLVKPRFVLSAGGELELVASPVRVPADYARYLDRPEAVIELGHGDAWYEPAIYKNPVYDLSATVRLLTGLWVKVRRRYVDRDRLVRDGVFNRASTAFAVHTALFERFAARARTAGMVPLVVIFPDRESLVRRQAGRAPIFTPLVDELRARGIDYLDLTEAFLAREVTQPPDGWFMPLGHYSPSANRLVAEWLGPRLLERVQPPTSAGPASRTDGRE